MALRRVVIGDCRLCIRREPIYDCRQRPPLLPATPVAGGSKKYRCQCGFNFLTRVGGPGFTSPFLHFSCFRIVSFRSKLHQHPPLSSTFSLQSTLAPYAVAVASCSSSGELHIHQRFFLLTLLEFKVPTQFTLHWPVSLRFSSYWVLYS